MMKIFNRNNIAHLLICCSVVLIGTGISILSLGWGLASAGLTCGLYGYLLGAE